MAQGNPISVAARMQVATQSSRRSGGAMVSVSNLSVETVLSGSIAEGPEIDPQQLRRPGLDAVRLRQGVFEESLFDLGDHLLQIQPLRRNLPGLRTGCRGGLHHVGWKV